MATNQELQATITKLEKENEKLKKGLLDGTTSTMERSIGVLQSTPFEDRVWEAVLIGAVSTLFDPSRISIDNRPKALDHYLARALRIADAAVVAARAHKEFNDKEQLKPADPLLDLLHPEPITDE
jgi:hypothetical protein